MLLDQSSRDRQDLGEVLVFHLCRRSIFGKNLSRNVSCSRRFLLLFLQVQGTTTLALLLLVMLINPQLMNWSHLHQQLLLYGPILVLQYATSKAHITSSYRQSYVMVASLTHLKIDFGRLASLHARFRQRELLQDSELRRSLLLPAIDQLLLLASLLRTIALHSQPLQSASFPHLEFQKPSLLDRPISA